jgi:RNA polymerase sigma factor for flagellar operon FliA
MAHPYSQLAYQGKSREEVVLEYAPLVRQIANRLAARLPASLDRNDLVQAGMIGLLDAMEKYDSRREAQFRTYAEFRIRGAMLDDLRASDWVPRSVRDNAGRVEHALVELTAALGRLPEEAEIAQRLGLSMADYHALLIKSKAIPLLSIEDLHGASEDGDHANIFDVLEDPACGDPLEALSLGDLKRNVAACIAELPERERLVLSLYYDEDLNLKEIGEVMGITESRVSQLRTQAILRLRAALKSTSSGASLDILLQKRAT